MLFLSSLPNHFLSDLYQKYRKYGSEKSLNVFHIVVISEDDIHNDLDIIGKLIHIVKV